MVVLGIDPGTAITGWGVINKEGHQHWETIAYGAIRTDKDTPFGLAYWVVKNAQEGFYGGNPAGFLLTRLSEKLLPKL